MAGFIIGSVEPSCPVSRDWVTSFC